LRPILLINSEKREKPESVTQTDVYSFLLVCTASLHFESRIL